MEINSPEDFREQPVIDIDVEFVNGSRNTWTINDEPDNQPTCIDGTLSFRFLNAQVSVIARNMLWGSIASRIDRIPLKKEGTPTPASQQPEGGMTGNERV